MSEFIYIFNPGARHWDEVKRAEKSLFIDTKQGGSGPGQLDLDEGFMVLRDQTGAATQTSTDIGNPQRQRPAKPVEAEHRSAADDITPPTADQNDN